MSSFLTLTQTIDLISVPFDLGASRQGARSAPHMISSMLARKLNAQGLLFTEQAIACPESLTTQIHDLKLKYLDEVVAVNEGLASVAANSVRNGHFPLVLGGDHSIAIGSIAGIASHRPNLGVIWFDAHADLNTNVTTPSGNIHGMSLAASLGHGDRRLTEIGGLVGKIKPENVVIIGARDLDPGEKSFIRDQGIKCYTMYDIDRKGMMTVIQEAIGIVTKGTDGVHLSFDLDSLDPSEAPGISTPVRGGVTYREAHLAVELLSEAGIVTSADIVELNPRMDKNNKTVTLAVELICSLFGSRIL
ncbi:arginase [Paenibacillus sp. PDC88]|uniref:arginase n=1 Tax=Paenibacillus sp. PDC88 TaxID=1884375 RepID=UPI00089B5431|nr:arginase [Paenibacillus sp. PDC88]SDX41849.1 arginase [Paenibacillus sp. PDC88]